MARNATFRVSPVKQVAGAWLEIPESIIAPSPFDQHKRCSLATSARDICKAARAGRRQPAFDFWSIVLGTPPPVPGVGARNQNIPGALTSIVDAHACFSGIERPLAEDNDGSDVVIYVLRPRFFYEYDPNMVCVASKVPVPSDVVFAVYARLIAPGPVVATDDIGVITHWGFVDADRADPKLPSQHGSRYRTRLW